MIKKKLSILTTLLLMAATGAVAQSTYSVTLKEGTEDAGHWTIYPTSAGAGVPVSATYNGSKHVKSVKYVKKLRTPEVTAPTAKSLTYTGSAQELVNAGSTTGGTMQYKVNDGSYSANIPKATIAGTYTVYYKVVGGEAYSDVDEASVSVTINKAVAAAKSDKTKWAVGDVICGNGNAYTIDANHKLPTMGSAKTAVVVYKGTATGEEGYQNGLALALTDASTGCKWKTSKGNNDNEKRSTTLGDQIGYKESGRTIMSRNNRSTNNAWPAFYYSNYSRYNVFYPNKTSTWFLPSLYQWNLMVKTLLGTDLSTSANSNLGYTKINEKIKYAIEETGGSLLTNAAYWTASENTSYRAWCYRANGLAGFNDKDGDLRVRPFIAF